MSMATDTLAIGFKERSMAMVCPLVYVSMHSHHPFRYMVGVGKFGVFMKENSTPSGVSRVALRWRGGVHGGEVTIAAKRSNPPHTWDCTVKITTLVLRHLPRNNMMVMSPQCHHKLKNERQAIKLPCKGQATKVGGGCKGAC
jgi:hypothetical protein